MISVTAFATLVLAGGTVWMACQTKRLAQKTATVAELTAISVSQEDKHHRERLRPICVLEPHSLLGSNLQRSALLTGGAPSRPPRVGYACQVACKIHNAGLGPALNPRMVVRFPGIGNREGSYEVPTMAGGDRLTPPIEASFTVDVERQVDDDKGPAIKEAIKKGGWEIYLEYTDVFGEIFYTKHSGDKENPWTVLEKGPIPLSVATQ